MCECFSVGLIYHQFNKMQNIGGALEQWCSGTVLVSCCCWMSPCRSHSYKQSSQSSQEAPKLASVGWRCGRWRGTQFGIYKTQTIHHLHIDYFPLHLQPMWSVSYYVPRPGVWSRHTNGNTERVSAPVWAALHLPYLKYSLWWINVQHIFRYFSDFVGRDLMPIFWQYSMLSLRSWHVHSAGPGRVNLELWKEPEWVLPHLICILFLTMELRCLRYGFCLIVKLGVANQAWNYNGYGLLIANYNVSTCHFILDFWETNDRHQ